MEYYKNIIDNLITQINNKNVNKIPNDIKWYAEGLIESLEDYIKILDGDKILEESKKDDEIQWNNTVSKYIPVMMCDYLLKE